MKSTTFVVSFHYVTLKGGILHSSYEVEASNEFEAQQKGMYLSKEFIKDYNENNFDDGIRNVSKIQFKK